ncbi:MAG TPA: ACT domain-containing protein [Nocardioidaceae bacterium]|nr:ACT domain-containing protein [Nocardioidaceae bacterium]
MTTYTLTRHPDALAVVRLGPGSEVPGWATSSTLFSVTATATETSLVCHASTVPARARREGPFVAFEVAGPLDFALTGVLSALLAPLADADISVFTVSTFDTDWLLVRADTADAAVDAWQAAGHAVRSKEDT